MDDNKVIRQLIRVNLELEGFEVVTAADGAECLEVVHQVRPDVVTLDVVMPRLDGLRTAALLRADPRTRALPLLIVSGCTPDEVGLGAQAAEARVDGYLAKPFEPGELVRYVRVLMERAGDGDGNGGRGESGGAAGPGGSGSGLGGFPGFGGGAWPGGAGPAAGGGGGMDGEAERAGWGLGG